MSEHGPDIVLVRHGETEWSRTGRHTGRTEIDLTALGEREAEATAALVQGVDYDLILCSPRGRAQHTARLAGLTPYEIEPDLVEWDYGDLEGLTSDQIHETLPDWDIWRGPWPGGETIEDVAARADRVVARALAAGPNGRVACVAHGHILRVLAARWIGPDTGLGRYLALDAAAVSRLGWEHAVRVVSAWNHVAPVPSED